jgi:hypothetical protein
MTIFQAHFISIDGEAQTQNETCGEDTGILLLEGREDDDETNFT